MSDPGFPGFFNEPYLEADYFCLPCINLELKGRLSEA